MLYGSDDMAVFPFLLHRELILPTSRTNAVLSIATTSNTGVAGQWLFRVDGTQVQLPGEETNQPVGLHRAMLISYYFTHSHVKLAKPHANTGMLFTT